MSDLGSFHWSLLFKDGFPSLRDLSLVIDSKSGLTIHVWQHSTETSRSSFHRHLPRGEHVSWTCDLESLHEMSSDEV